MFQNACWESCCFRVSFCGFLGQRLHVCRWHGTSSGCVGSLEAFLMKSTASRDMLKSFAFLDIWNESKLCRVASCDDFVQIFSYQLKHRICFCGITVPWPLTSMWSCPAVEAIVLALLAVPRCRHWRGGHNEVLAVTCDWRCFRVIEKTRDKVQYAGCQTSPKISNLKV